MCVEKASKKQNIPIIKGCTLQIKKGKIALCPKKQLGLTR